MADKVYKAIIGNAMDTKFKIVHGLDVSEPLILLFEYGGNKAVPFLPVTHIVDENTIELEFSNPPDMREYLVSIHKPESS